MPRNQLVGQSKTNQIQRDPPVAERTTDKPNQLVSAVKQMGDARTAHPGSAHMFAEQKGQVVDFAPARQQVKIAKEQGPIISKTEVPRMQVAMDDDLRRIRRIGVILTLQRQKVRKQPFQQGELTGIGTNSRHQRIAINLSTHLRGRL